MDDWDKVSSPAADARPAGDMGATGFRDAVSTARPLRPPVRRKGISGSSIAIVVLSLAVIGQAVFIGLNIFHAVNIKGVASAPAQPLSGVLATVEAEATKYAAISKQVPVMPPPSGTYLLTQECPRSGTNYWIVNARTGLVMDVAGGSKASGGAVIQYPEGNGGLNQLWQFGATGTGEYFDIVNVNSGLLLDEPDGSQASGIGIIQNPDDGALSQQWQCVYVGNNRFKIVSANSGLVLDVADTNLAQIAPLLQDSYTGGLNQQWLFVL